MVWEKVKAMNGIFSSSAFRVSAKAKLHQGVLALMATLSCADELRAATVFDTFSPYHHIQVLDQGGIRTLSFNGSMETRMSLTNSLRGHFEYTEYFHTPWIWNTNIKQVLMIGLGGGSTQRSYGHYYTNVTVDTVELDPVVVTVAKKYFNVTESPRHRIYNEDGRFFLRRATTHYDVILMDAYTTGRYGSSIPPHLTTKEFFKIASDHLGTNGVMAYNIIGQIHGWNSEFVGALYKTMKDVFPQVYLFPAVESQNVVLVATKSSERYDLARALREGGVLVRSDRIKLPAFSTRLRSFSNTPPPGAARATTLTDDRAPVESLLR
jgi:spermidine synthase